MLKALTLKKKINKTFKTTSLTVYSSRPFYVLTQDNGFEDTGSAEPGDWIDTAGFISSIFLSPSEWTLVFTFGDYQGDYWFSTSYPVKFIFAYVTSSIY